MTSYSKSKDESRAENSIERSEIVPINILAQLSISSGSQRREQLDKLHDDLKEKVREGDNISLLECLRSSAGDIQRIALQVVVQCDAVTSLPVSGVLSAILIILNRLTNTGSSLPSLSACRTCASVFRALKRIFNEVDPSRLTNLDIPLIVSISTKCLRYGLNDVLLARSSQNSMNMRAGPGSALAFQNSRNRNSFTDRDHLSNSKLKKQSSSSSLRSTKSTTQSIVSAGWESESGVSASEREGEEDMEKQTRSTCRAIRSQAIQFLEILNVKMTKSLLLHWPRLLSESNEEYACLMDIVEVDTTISNRISACRTIESFLQSGNSSGFFNGAEERTRLSAFTSLSSRIASIIVQIRSRLIKALQIESAVTVKEAVIRCTTTLVEMTAKAKLRQSHADSIRSIALKFCSSTNANIAVKSHTLLSAILSSAKSGSMPLSNDHSEIGKNLLSALKSDDNAPKLKAEAWTTLIAMIDTLAQDHNIHETSEDLVSLAFYHLSSEFDELRQAASLYTLAMMKSGVDHTLWEKHIDRMQQDKYPPIRAIAADCLSIVDVESNKLALLCNDPDSSVRAAAIRAVGVAIQSKKREVHRFVVQKSLSDPSALVRQRASWTLGNLCEITANSELLSDCLVLKNDDERITVHAIRGLGALLEKMEVDSMEKQSQMVVDAMKWLQAILQTSKDPKLRWNTCTCIGRMYSNGYIAVVGLFINQDSQNSIGLPMLLAHLVCNDKMFKTRLSACTALISLFERYDIGKIPSDMISELRQNILNAKSSISSQLEEVSFKERQLHVIPLQKSIETLSDLMLKDAKD